MSDHSVVCIVCVRDRAARVGRAAASGWRGPDDAATVLVVTAHAATVLVVTAHAATVLVVTG